jgi:NAD(P)-dependent dehydrogenase (short-subunit alcohol dehydrogenase family)
MNATYARDVQSYITILGWLPPKAFGVTRSVRGATKTNIAETMPSQRVDAEGAARAGAFAALIPAFLEPGDIANLALFLASDESRHINGAIIPADADWTAA